VGELCRWVDGFRRVEIVVLDADSVEASLEAAVVVVVLVTVVAPCVNPAAAALLYCFTSSYSSTP
jgi:hypothetical protein